MTLNLIFVCESNSDSQVMQIWMFATQKIQYNHQARNQ